MLLRVVNQTYMKYVKQCEDAPGLQRSNLCNNVVHERFCEAEEIAWKQISSLFFFFPGGVEKRVEENFCTLPVFRNNLYFQDSVLKKLG